MPWGIGLDSTCLEILKAYSNGETFRASKVARTLGVHYSVASRHLKHLTETGVLDFEAPNIYALRANGNGDRLIVIQLLSELADIDKEIRRLEANRIGLEKAIGKAIEYCSEEEQDGTKLTLDLEEKGVAR